MQLRLPFVTRTRRVSGPRLRPPVRIIAVGREFDLDVVRHPRARRYVLRLAGDRLKLTVPRGASIAGGVRFAERQAPWIDREWRRQRDRAQPWTASTALWWRGERRPAGEVAVAIGAHVSAEAGDLREPIVRALRAIAGRELPLRCLELASRHGLKVARVSVRNQRSRWGACSSRGVITLNWRLVHMPPAVSDYIVLHELAHLLHANHSRRFWKAVERLCPDWREAEGWIRQRGREIL